VGPLALVLFSCVDPPTGDSGVDFVDRDEDGYYTDVDCADDDPDVNPGVPEICGDGLDNDCSGDAGVCAYEGAAELRDSWAVYTGDEPEHQAGISTVLAGDVDGDGRRDLAVGAWGRDGTYLESGAVYLITEPLPGTHHVGDVATTVLEGAADSENMGWALDGDQDLDGDGLADLVIGTADFHRAYVVHGPITTSGLAAHAGAVWVHTAGSFAGTAVALSPDATGDGLPDVLIGAWSDDGGAVDAGAAFLVAGPVTASGVLSDATAVLTGVHAGGQAGLAVHSAGDTDGDGISEVVVGAPGATRDGEAVGGAYLFLGPVTGALSLDDAAGVALGNALDGSAGASLAGGRDLDGDGLKDLAIGAPLAGVDIYGTGAVYVLHGPVSGTLGLEDADGTLWGESWEDAAGIAVTAPGDLDGDAIGDLVIGADGHDEPHTNAGRIYVVLGPVAGNQSLVDAPAWYQGPISHGHAGAALDGAGDVDADGMTDLLIGAYLDGSASNNAGAVYVVRGRAGE